MNGDHDQLCHQYDDGMSCYACAQMECPWVCTCYLISKVRDDERERAVQRLGDFDRFIVDRMFTVAAIRNEMT